MDYIRQELLRQRAALARLLLGGKAEESERNRAETYRMSESDGGAETGGTAWYAAAEAAWSGLRETAWAPGGKNLAGGAAEGGEASGRGSAQTGGGTLTAGWGEEEMREPLKSGQTAAGDEIAPAAAGKRWLLAGSGGEELWQEALAQAETGERTGERALSRLIQRDARRYDGGFSLY